MRERAENSQKQKNSRRSGGFISIGIVLTLAGAMAATLLGAGVFTNTVDVADGAHWLWSVEPGSASRVNSHSGRVDMTQPVVDSRGHRVRVTQNDRFLILHDLETGRLTSVDLTRMGFTGTITVDRNADIVVVLHDDVAAIIDRTNGRVRGIDPVTLRSTGVDVRATPPLVGGAFDDDGTLWVGVPREGTVTQISITPESGRIVRTYAVADPDTDLELTVLDHGAVVVDRTGERVSVIRDEVTTLEVPGGLDGAVLPDRTVGDLVAVTLPEAGAVIAIDLTRDREPVRFRLPSGVQAGVAVPFHGRIYVPDLARTDVLVFNPTGEQVSVLELEGAEGDLELEVRENHLFINSPQTNVAEVIDEEHVSRRIDKYQNNVPGGENGPAGYVAPAPRPVDTPEDNRNDQDNASNQERTGPPGPPVPVTAVAGDRMVQLTWGAAAPNGAEIQRYTITWDGGSRQVDGTVLSLEITDLENGRPYMFTVVATNRYGDSPPAMSETVTPGDDVPAQVGKPTAEPLPDGSVEVSWTEVSGGDSYVVTTLLDGAPYGTPVTAAVSPVPISGLELGQTYTFTVQARNASGQGGPVSPPSDPVTAAARPDAPGNVQGFQASATTYEISWDAANDNGSPVTDYVVRDEQGNQLASVDAQTTTAQITSNQTLTRVQVVAINAIGESQPGWGDIQQATAPSPPRNVWAEQVSANTYEVSWDPPASDGGSPLTHYWIGTPAGTTLAETGPDELSVTFTATDTITTIQVVAANVVGDSQPAEVDVSPYTPVTMTGQVRCVDNDNDGVEYCTEGVGVYPQPYQIENTELTVLPNGTMITAFCQIEGEHIYADRYNNNRSSAWWVDIGDGAYIPWAWTDLPGDLDPLPLCDA